MISPKQLLSILLIISCCNQMIQVEGKIFSKCDLAKELARLRISSRTFLTNWVCLVEHESGRNTSKYTELTNQSASYGIFQINSKDYCGRGYQGGLCNIRCEQFLTDSIVDDVTCASRIFNERGFQYWSGWMRQCKQKPLPDLSNCVF